MAYTAVVDSGVCDTFAQNKARHEQAVSPRLLPGCAPRRKGRLRTVKSCRRRSLRDLRHIYGRSSHLRPTRRGAPSTAVAAPPTSAARVKRPYADIVPGRSRRGGARANRHCRSARDHRARIHDARPSRPPPANKKPRQRAGASQMIPDLSSTFDEQRSNRQNL
jgi:hypothetical protein